VAKRPDRLHSLFEWEGTSNVGVQNEEWGVVFAENIPREGQGAG
jgi:hypothetical protein